MLARLLNCLIAAYTGGHLIVPISQPPGVSGFQCRSMLHQVTRHDEVNMRGTFDLSHPVHAVHDVDCCRRRAGPGQLKVILQHALHTYMHKAQETESCQHSKPSHTGSTYTLAGWWCKTPLRAACTVSAECSLGLRLYQLYAVLGP